MVQVEILAPGFDINAPRFPLYYEKNQLIRVFEIPRNRTANSRDIFFYY